MLSDSKEPKIIEIDYSLAFTSSSSGIIYINKDLKKYDLKLYDQIIEHERSHHTGPYDTKDLENDMNVIFPLKEKIKFCMKYPKGWFFLLPIASTKDEILIDWLGICKYLIIALLAMLFIKLWF